MSMQAPIIYCRPEEAARVARESFPKGNAYLRLYDALGPIYTNPQFAALFPKDGQPAAAPAQLALVTIFRSRRGCPTGKRRTRCATASPGSTRCACPSTMRASMLPS